MFNYEMIMIIKKLRISTMVLLQKLKKKTVKTLITKLFLEQSDLNRLMLFGQAC